MNANVRLYDIETAIKRHFKDVYTEVIKFKKIDRPLLFVIRKKHDRILKLFDETKGLNEIAVIRYSITKDRVFVSTFEVNKDYQQKGIGKFMFQFALAHSDLLGATYLYGHADPIDEIKGVSKYGYKAELMALI